ncbi:aldolase/citrate lyase family protein [Halomonas ramblicola]|uniref:aldolase/citrate lyase family protein n=1 Tax=Halomonas ramblicola TaxID=747349 RepID=UPI0025B3BB28|nr:aldolase/citrate lyase family protein [Halomonas ramblicola]MDN3522000.1 aldolase/citrate lyase family protein [Halomonas ramblicola]
MQTPVNPFKQALLEGRPQTGLWLSLADAYAAEVVAGSGADWLLIDGEHSPLTIDKTLAMLQTLAAYPVAPVVRPLWNDKALIKQLLDIGATNLLLPYVQSAEEAAQIVRWTRYAPRGVRGMASGAVRASRFGRVGDYIGRCEQELCLVAQIETRGALDCLEEIAAVEGIDALFVGPADLAADLGYAGQPGHPEVVAAVEDALQRIAAVGKAPGVLSVDLELARRYAEAGSVFTAVGVDIVMLARSSEHVVASFREHALPADS